MWIVAIFVIIIGTFLILSWVRLEQMHRQNIVSVPSREPDEVPTDPISQFWLWYWIIFGLFLLFQISRSLSGSTAHILNQVTPVVLLMMLVAFTRAVYVWLKPVKEETPSADQLVDSEEYTSCNLRTSDVFYSSLGSEEFQVGVVQAKQRIRRSLARVFSAPGGRASEQPGHAAGRGFEIAHRNDDVIEGLQHGRSMTQAPPADTRKPRKKRTGPGAFRSIPP